MLQTEPASNPMIRVAYLTTKYPALSHTFIEREVAAARQEGAEIHTFTVRRTSPEQLTCRAMRIENSTTRALRDAPRDEWLRAARHLARVGPGVLVPAVVLAARTGFPTLRSRVWQQFYLLEAIILWHAMTELQLRHVHVHHANVPADVARLACYIGNYVDGPGAWTWSLTVHGSAEFEMVHQWDVANKVRSAVRVSCISDYCRGQLMRLVEAEHWGKITKAHMSVEVATYVPPSVPRQHDGPVRLLTVGRLVPLKGIEVLLHAMKTLDNSGRAMTLRVIGEGDNRRPLEDLAQVLGLLEHVHFTGAVGQDDILSHYHWADVFVMPSLLEGLPVVLMEAMSTELPIVVSRVGAVEELVTNGTSGLVVPMAREDVLAAALTQLAVDSNLRRKMGRNGRESVIREFSSEEAGVKMKGFFDAIFDAKCSR